MSDVDTGEHAEGFDEAERALAEARSRLAAIPAATVVANHAIGLYELAALHLSSQPPDLVQASLAIDAFGALVDSVGHRLDDDADTLHQALTTIRMAFVSLSEV